MRAAPAAAIGRPLQTKHACFDTRGRRAYDSLLWFQDMNATQRSDAATSAARVACFSRTPTPPPDDRQTAARQEPLHAALRCQSPPRAPGRPAPRSAPRAQPRRTPPIRAAGIEMPFLEGRCTMRAQQTFCQKTGRLDQIASRRRRRSPPQSTRPPSRQRGVQSAASVGFAGLQAPQALGPEFPCYEYHASRSAEQAAQVWRSAR